MRKLLSCASLFVLMIGNVPCVATAKPKAVNYQAVTSIKASSQWVEVQPGQNINHGSNLVSGMPDRKWWLEFNDPYLSQYIQKALAQSPTIKSALMKIDQGRAQVRQSLSYQLPSIATSGVANRIHLPTHLVPNSVINRNFNAYALFGSVQYELDLWGKYWNATQAARQEVKALQNDEKAMEVLLAADVATAYFNMIRAEQLVDYNQQYIHTLQELLRLTTANYQVGLDPYETVLRLQRDIAQKGKDLNAFQEQKELFAHQLSVLTGVEPATIQQLPHKTLDQVEIPQQVQMGLPLLVIRQRPDIRAQEERLEKLNIDVRIARKNFLPTIKISDFVGFSTQKFKTLFDGDSFFNILAGSIGQSVFQGGKKLADLRLQQAAQREQIENYRQSILKALQEVEDSLVTLQRSYADQKKNTQAVHASENSVFIADSLYHAGLGTRLDLMQAQNERLGYQSSAISDRANTANAIVSLYKALGGGF